MFRLGLRLLCADATAFWGCLKRQFGGLKKFRSLSGSFFSDVFAVFVYPGPSPDLHVYGGAHDGKLAARFRGQRRHGF